MANTKITSRVIADDAVLTANIADDAVTSAKLDTNIAIAGTLGVTGAVTADAGVSIDNITIDGTEIDLSSGDLTIDVAGDITLDADGADIIFADGGTTFLEIDKDGNNARIKNPISDGDIKIQGNDGGSIITAIDIDMSAGGRSTFAGNLTLSQTGASDEPTLKIASENTSLFMRVAGSSGSFPSGGSGNDLEIFSTGAANDFRIGCGNSSSNLIFINGSSYNERMRITSAGDLYFAQTSGSVNDVGTILQANGRNFFMASTTSEAIMHTYNNTSNSGAKYIISFRQNNTEVGSIEVGTSSTNLVGSSDYRLKENIKTLSNGLDRVKKLKPVQFDWKKDGETSEGFLAHEVQEAGWNEGVTGEKDGERMQCMDYGRITPLLVKAIQELSAKNDALEARIKTLEDT